MKKEMKDSQKADMPIEKKASDKTWVKELAVALVALVLAIAIFVLYSDHQQKEREILGKDKIETRGNINRMN